jgi:membrane protein implicated in regulation of membrane protease activity
VLLGGVGVLEAVVYPWRYRAAVDGSRLANVLSALVLTVMRVAFVWLGASAVMRETPWPLALAVYALPATIATAAVSPARKRASAEKPS